MMRSVDMRTIVCLVLTGMRTWLVPGCEGTTNDSSRDDLQQYQESNIDKSFSSSFIFILPEVSTNDGLSEYDQGNKTVEHILTVNDSSDDENMAHNSSLTELPIPNSGPDVKSSINFGDQPLYHSSNEVILNIHLQGDRGSQTAEGNVESILGSSKNNNTRQRQFWNSEVLSGVSSDNLNGNTITGGTSNRIIGSSPEATVSMVESFVKDLITKPSGDRPGYIMINSPNPALINQLTTVLTQRYGSSAVMQDPNSPNAIADNTTIATPVTPDNNNMPVFPHNSAWVVQDHKSLSDTGPLTSNDDYIKHRLASIANLSISSGHLVNETLDKSSPATNTSIHTTSTQTPDTGYTQTIPEVITDFIDSFSGSLHKNKTSISENSTFSSPKPITLQQHDSTQELEVLSQIHIPESSHKSQELPKDEYKDTVLKNSLTYNISVSSNIIAGNKNDDESLPDIGFGYNITEQKNDSTSKEQISQEANVFENIVDSYLSVSENRNSSADTSTSSPVTSHTQQNSQVMQYLISYHNTQKNEQNSHTDALSLHNEVSTTGYEDYYEEIDGEFVLSPTKFMRKSGPIYPGDYNEYDYEDPAAVMAVGNQVNDSPSFEQDFPVTIDHIEQTEQDKSSILVSYESVGSKKDGYILPSSKLKVPFEVMSHLVNMNSNDLEVLGLQHKIKDIVVTNVNTEDAVKSLGEEQAVQTGKNSENFQKIHEFQNDNRTHEIRKVSSNELQTVKHFKFNAGNYRQSDDQHHGVPTQHIPPNFFPPRPTESAQHDLGHHHDTHTPQLTQEQLEIISQLPIGMRHIVSSIVQAVQTPFLATTTTTPTPQHLPYPYPYPTYPYYPPLGYPYQALPFPPQGTAHHNQHQAAPITNTVHSNNGALNNHDSQAIHGNHGAHDSHNTHITYDSSTNHGTQESHAVHTSHGAHSNHDHETHNNHHTHSSYGEETSIEVSNDHSPQGSLGTDIGQGSSNVQSDERTSNLHTHTTTFEDARLSGSSEVSLQPAVVTPETPLRPNVAHANRVPLPGVPFAPSTTSQLELNPNHDATRNVEDNSAKVQLNSDKEHNFNEINRIGIGAAPTLPDRNQGHLQLNRDSSQMGNGHPSGGGFVSYRPPQQSNMHMGSPVLNVVLPETTTEPATDKTEVEIGPLINPDPPTDKEEQSDEATNVMDRQEVNSLLQSLFSSPTLLLLGIIFAASAAYMAIAMEEQASQQRFQQAQLAAAFAGQPFPQGRRSHRDISPDLMWYPRRPKIQT